MFPKILFALNKKGVSIIYVTLYGGGQLLFKFYGNKTVLSPYQVTCDILMSEVSDFVRLLDLRCNRIVTAPF
jgi:hypothetical protein